jgi:hypothetical protein
VKCEATNSIGTKEVQRLIAYKQTFSEESFRVETNQSQILVDDEAAFDCVAVNCSFEIDLEWFHYDQPISGILTSKYEIERRRIYFSFSHNITVLNAVKIFRKKWIKRCGISQAIILVINSTQSRW